jgi:hypothetical protein
MIKTKTKINTILQEEEGSSMVEFAIVLPVLIVLTIGSIYLSVGFTQKSIMNGLAFMETRAASVRQQHSMIAEHAVKNYMKSTEGQQKWLEEAKSEIKVDIKTNDLTVIVTKDAMNTEILSNALNIIGGRKPDGKTEIKKVKSAMVLPIEYITLAKRSDRPFTSTTVNYETSPIGGDFIGKHLLDKLPKSVSDMIIPNSLVDPKKDNGSDIGQIHDSKRADGILGSDSTRNSERLNKAYDYWGLDKIGNSEKPKSLSIKKINTVGFLQVTAENIAIIESGANLAQVAAKFSTFGPIVEVALKPIQSVGAVVLPTVEKVGTNFAEIAETNNNRMFKKSLIGVD